MPTLTAKQNGNYKVNGYNTLHVNVQPGGGGGGTAASISYDNTISALTATNVQAAIDELASDISAISVPDPSSTTPLMDGVATVGSEVRFARGDHVHPTDTSRVPTSRTVNGHALSSNITLTASDVGALADSTVIPTRTSDLTNDSGFITSSDVPDASSTTPLMDGTASTGSEDDYARGDHVHPHDDAKVDVAGDTMEGTLEVLGLDSVGGNHKEFWCDVSKNEVLAQDSSLTTSSSTADWQTALLKAICAKYPNMQGVLFRGTLVPSSRAFYEVEIYDTSMVSGGLPQYSFGTWRQYTEGYSKFWTSSYTFGSANVDTNTTYSAGTYLSLNGTTINHDNSGVSAGTKGTNSTTALTPGFGSTFNVIGLAVDATGHITSANSHTVKMPNSAATTSAAGLMTTAQVTKLNGIATNATKNSLSRTQNTRSATYSISANASKSGTIAASVPSGYTVMGLGSINSGNTAVAIVTAGVDSTGKVTYVLRNVSSSSFTNQTATFDIVYIKIA